MKRGFLLQDRAGQAMEVGWLPVCYPTTRLITKEIYSHSSRGQKSKLVSQANREPAGLPWLSAQDTTTLGCSASGAAGLLPVACQPLPAHSQDPLPPTKHTVTRQRIHQEILHGSSKTLNHNV